MKINVLKEVVGHEFCCHCEGIRGRQYSAQTSYLSFIDNPTVSGQGFGNLVQKTSGTGGAASSNTSMALARMSSIAASMDPDAFTTAQSLAWMAYAVAIKPA